MKGASGFPLACIVRYSWDCEGGRAMLWTIFVILLILWLLGFSVWHVGALIHILLVAAVIVLIIRLVQSV
jgi:hypothetical protein